MADSVRPEEFFRDRYGVSPGALERVLGSALARHADDGDLYFEFRTSEALSLEEGQVKKANKDVSQGVGVDLEGSGAPIKGVRQAPHR